MTTKALLISFLALLLCTTSVFGATEKELRERFKARYPELRQLKQDGKLGETYKGYVEAVKAEYASEVQALLGEENSDRRELYQLLAKQTDVTPDDVAQRNAVRNFEKARKGEWLKHTDGKWRQK